ncbi:hypothetical protein ACOSQ3_002442 [Xanthoceras sorbifolium]
MPVNVDGYHWVLAAVNLVERKVRIYDSLCKDTDPSFREQYVAPLAVLLPSLMYSGGYFQHRGRQVHVTPFACKRLVVTVVHLHLCLLNTLLHTDRSLISMQSKSKP